VTEQLYGWIDAVEDGMVYGRLCDDTDLSFEIPIFAVPECQRVELQPGSYCTILNGYLLLDKTIWTTKDMEDADREAKAWGEPHPH
jgi:hypothetical protein